VKGMGKGKPFLEVLASAMHEDFRFPFLELFAFLYTLGTFALANFTVGVYSQVGTNEAVAYAVTSSLIGGSHNFHYTDLQKCRLRFGKRPGKRNNPNILFVSPQKMGDTNCEASLRHRRFPASLSRHPDFSFLHFGSRHCVASI